jgi:hypothetical protein
MGIKVLILVLTLVFVATVVLIVFNKSKNEDDWVCENGQWTWHGNPDNPKPSFPCGTIQEVIREVPAKK